MISLRERQHSFMKALIDSEDVGGDAMRNGCEARLQVYRNNYRSALIDAMEETFVRTARLTGMEAFHQAAIHHIIEHPPSSWTIDAVGEGFPETCRELFGSDPDVAEIAWLEWAMGQASIAADADPLTIESFSQTTAHFSDDEWERLKLSFVPSVAVRSTGFDLLRLWRSLASDCTGPEVSSFANRKCVMVCREGETPVFALIAEDEGQALSLMLDGASFGDVCEALYAQHGSNAAIERAGQILRVWLDGSLVREIAGR